MAKKLSKKKLKEIEDKIEWEGLDYALQNYLSEEDVPDEKFQEFRKDYLEARKKIERWLDEHEIGMD